MSFKQAIRLEDRAKIATWLGDSQVWMATTVRLDGRSGRVRSDGTVDHSMLNVGHVCTGLAFELALKVLAVSDGRSIVPAHEVDKNYRNLGKTTQERLRKFVADNEKTPSTIEELLKYLDESMCNPDRKYWMVGKTGAMSATGFAQNLPGLVIPDLAILHAEIINMAGKNAFVA